ncbi:MAG: 1-deoxy-D-xylulose-5-phosphate reductoisomerase [Clostridia bacterium]|nr:1-deoxy-D-xylulose-5-phosphate reductoisomerase [Clostridia bacterium]
MKKVAILGSTGSIGTQTLDVIRKNADKLQVVSLVAFSREEKLLEQVKEFNPSYYGLISKSGEQCLIEAVQDADVAVVATIGITALKCVIYCLENGIDVALANKETLVCGGELVMYKVGKAKLYTIDSEHCSISQCIASRDGGKVNKILLTASGGPFWNCDVNSLCAVTPAEALAHPNWSMGSKITVDSATMFNKTLEVLEAHWLFGLPLDKIQIVVHRQSIVHSMVSFTDGSVMAQMAMPDMRLPIQIALLGNGSQQIIAPIDFTKLVNLTFQPCDVDKFPCANLSYEVFDKYPLAPTIMNSANDVCVEFFLKGKLAFDKYYSTITNVVEHFASQLCNVSVTVDNIINWDKQAQTFTKNLLNGVV